MNNIDLAKTGITDGRVLLVKLSALGDVMAFSPLPHLIKKRYSNIAITHMVMRPSEPATMHNPFIDKHIISEALSITLKVKKLISVYSLYVRLKKEKFDCAIVYHRSVLIVLFLRLTGIKNIYSYCTSSLPSRYGNLRHHTVKYDVDVNRTYLDWKLTRLCFPTIEYPTGLEYYFDKKKNNVLLSSKYPDIAYSGYITLSVGGGNYHSNATNRLWPYYHYIALIKLLPKYKFVLLGKGEPDEIIARTIMNMRPSNVMSLVGKCSFDDTAKVISDALLHIGGDSSLLFVSAAVKTTFFGLYGPTDPASAFPFTNNRASRFFTSSLLCSPCYNPIESLNSMMYKCTENKCMQGIAPTLIATYVTRYIEANNGNL